MSSIENDRRSRAVRKFFEKELLPLADRLRARGKTFFPTQPDPDLPTYFKKRPQTPVSPRDFELPGTTSPAALGPALADLWNSPADAELRALIPALTRLATSLHAAGGPDQDQELSPFIYVMF